MFRFVCAVGLVGIHGNFVIKMFTLFEHHSLSLLALMSVLFNEVNPESLAYYVSVAVLDSVLTSCMFLIVLPRSS